MIVVHHGANQFDKTKWNDISTVKFRNKPTGGLWTSPKDSTMSWFDWCERNDFATGDNSLSFEIDISDSKILQVVSTKDLDEYKIHKYDVLGYVEDTYVNFNKIAEKYDCLFVTEKAIKESMYVYTEFNLYGWDCETVIIMNNEIIKEK